MSKDNLPARYYPPGYKGYRLDQDEFGNSICFDPIPKPQKYNLVLTKPVDKKIKFAEVECLKEVFKMTEQEAYNAVKAAMYRGDGYIIYSGYAEQCDTKGAFIESSIQDLMKAGYYPDGLRAHAIKLG